MRKAWTVGAALLCLGAAARAGAPAPDAAEALGRAGDAAALARILDQHDAAQLTAFRRGFDDVAGREGQDRRTPLQPALEQVLVAHFDDPQLGRKALALCLARKYQSQALFDRLYAHIADADRADGHPWPALVVNTNLPGIEPALLAALPRLDRDAQALVLGALASRHAPGAGAAIQRWIDAGDENGIERAYYWLTDLATPEAAAVAVANLARYAGALDARQRGHLASLLSALIRLPPTVPLDMAAVIARVPHKDDAEVQQTYLALLEHRPDPAAVPDLLRALDVEATRQRALGILLQVGSVDAWRQARAHVEAARAGLPEPFYRWATGELDRRVQSPGEFLQQAARQNAGRSFDAERTAALKPYYDVARLRTQDPARYVTQMAAKIAAMQALVARYPGQPFTTGTLNDIDNDRLNIALTQRFALRRPAEAVATDLQVGPRLQWIALMDAAETLRFDLHDAARAAELYARARDLAPPADARAGDEREVLDWLRRWAGQEAETVRSGRPFSGALRREDCAGAGMLVMFGMASPLAPDASAPPSWHLAALALSPERPLAAAEPLLATLERNDPTRFLSACLLAGIEMFRQQGSAARLPPGWEQVAAASALFQQRNHIQLAVAADARFATPEQTWAAMIAALRSGDRAAALACYDGEMKETLGKLFGAMSDAELKVMADSFGALTASSDYGEFREFFVTRRQGEGPARAGVVTFVHAAGEWLIQSM